MGPVDTSNQSPTIHYSGGKYASLNQHHHHQHQLQHHLNLHSIQQQSSALKEMDSYPKSLIGAKSTLGYNNGHTNAHYWNSTTATDASDAATSAGIESSPSLDLKQPLFPNIPSIINTHLHGGNNSQSPYHQHQHLSISWPQFQPSHQEPVQGQRSQNWDVAHQPSSSAPSSPESNNNHTNNNSIVHIQQQQVHHQQQLQQQVLPHLPQFNYHPIQASQYTTPDSSPLLSPTTSYISSSHGYDSQHQQLFIVEDDERESKRKTSLKVAPSPLDYGQSYHHTLPYPQTAVAEPLVSKKLKFDSVITTFAQPPYVSASAERDTTSSVVSISSRVSSPSSNDVAFSASAQITPPSTPAAHCQHQPYQYESSPGTRPHSPPSDNFFVYLQQTATMTSYGSASSPQSHHHQHHHISAPSSPNYHASSCHNPISLPLLLTASPSLPATPTLTSSQYDVPSSPHAVCNCLHNRNVNRGPADQALECMEFNVPLEQFEDWIEAEGKMVGVSYIKSGGKVIGAHADRKTLNLKAEYEKPRTGLRRTKRELLWTQKYVCSRAGFPKRRADSDIKDTLNRKKVVSKKCGCQSRIVVSVYADDKQLAVVRKIADHSAHMSPQQMNELQLVANQHRHNYCLVHPSTLPAQLSLQNQQLTISEPQTAPESPSHIIHQLQHHHHHHQQQQQPLALNNYSIDNHGHQIQQQQMQLGNNNFHLPSQSTTSMRLNHHFVSSLN